ncbi:ring finger domain protein [Diplodia corticola]|uniref:Ring finger domain protein n=1 Tax=Diplodia corticola TaxID=236234 RepID=A0A1J9SBD6_9PEZI|nr:ring finger domain protein [Diplodia corticola]OJD37799.1 ring finger domain protein [Diplodia corticola]
MSPHAFLALRDESAPAAIPLGGRVISMVLSLVTLTILAICITRRVENVGRWSRLPITGWLIIIIYFDSFLFVFVTAMFKDIGINESQGICEGAILLCLVCYMSTKVFIYTFLVEKAYIVRGSHKPRLSDRLYVFNAFGLITPYVGIVILNFVWKIAYIDDMGTCIIGMQKKAMMPLIIFDVVINVYLTALFIIPLRRLFSYQHNTNKSLRIMALRTFVGSCATLISSVVNLTVLMALKGEPGWICLMCCNADSRPHSPAHCISRFLQLSAMAIVLFSVLVLHWVTSFDKSTTDSSYAREQNRNNDSGTIANRPSRNGTFPTANSSVHSGHPETKANVGGLRRDSRCPAHHKTGWDAKASIKTQCCAGNDQPNPEDIAMDRIVVRTERILKIESDNHSDRSESSAEPESGSGSRGCSSTDGIVNRV